MRRTLPTLVLAACLSPLACAAVQPGAVKDAGAQANIQRMKLTPQNAPANKIKTAYGVQQVPAAAGIAQPRVERDTVIKKQAEENDGWKSYGTLLATLLVMAAIAFRRHRNERPWR